MRQTWPVPVLDRHRDRRRLAIALVERELERLRGEGPAGVGALASGPPAEAERDDGILVTTRVVREPDRWLVLVEASSGRRMLATGGFAMGDDGSTHTPH